MYEIQSEDEFYQRRAQSPVLLAYFSTPECRVCKTLRPMVTDILDEQDVAGVYVDTTRWTGIAGQLLVFAVPTMVVFVNEREVARLGRHLSMQELNGQLERAKTLASPGEDGGYADLFG